MTIFNLFSSEKTAMVLMALAESSGSSYSQVLAREIGSVYCHAVNIVNRLEEMGIVTSEKQGRVKYITLTKDGWEIANYIKAIQDKIDRLSGVKKNGK